MDDQDWNPVVVRKNRGPPGGRQANSKVAQQARQQGAEVDTVRRYGGGTNRRANPSINMRKLDSNDDDEEVALPSMDRNVALEIQRARLAKKWTQADLARRINEKQSVVNDYESGRCIPNPQILSKMRRQLGVRLAAPKKR
eukprot:gnl/Trimastix_PCT/1579.p2 GENE.gnl/Trimastix_PCT/1579~~gnl/Trimastix_PCT/1579.p2  ORF type:complete len:149 (-),score=29.68 gnl/Trimastix_PCT/1579:34-456(-)